MIATIALGASALYAQQRYDFSVYGGGAFTSSTTISNQSAGSADAGFNSGWSAGAAFGQDLYKYIGGEVRYSYQHQQMKLSNGSGEATFSGDSQAIGYDMVFHFTPRKSHVRPYVSAGGGGKYFRGTGAESAVQPLSDIAVLTKTGQWVGMVSFGGGVKVAFSHGISLRVDVHDYMTPFPNNVIAPAPGSSVSGWVNNIVPTVGLTFNF
jgi:hypothetical protein